MTTAHEALLGISITDGPPLAFHTAYIHTSVIGDEPVLRAMVERVTDQAWGEWVKNHSPLRAERTRVLLCEGPPEMENCMELLAVVQP